MKDVVVVVVEIGLEQVGIVDAVGVGGQRLAGVKINHLIKRKSIGVVWGEIMLGRGEPVRKEMKIVRRGRRRRE